MGPIWNYDFFFSRLKNKDAFAGTLEETPLVPRARVADSLGPGRRFHTVRHIVFRSEELVPNSG